MRAALPVALVVVLLLPACSSLSRSAQKDPMRCERDPNCARHSERARDCSTQCNYDPACTDRCREMTSDGLGHK